jgi:hypothetical protein
LEAEKSFLPLQPASTGNGIPKGALTGGGGKEKKVLRSAWRLKNSSYLCNPLRNERFTSRTGRGEKKKKIEGFAWRLGIISDLCTPKTTTGCHGKKHNTYA